MPKLKTGFREVQNVSISQEGNEGTMLVYGMIGQVPNWYDGDIEALSDVAIMSALNQLVADGATVINVRINSPGGYVFDGSAIVNAIKRCKAEVHTWNDGIAASMAFPIWAAGHKKHQASNSLFMAHSASTICWGNAAEMRNEAEFLEKMDGTLSSTLAEACGKTKAEVQAQFMDGKDHWLDADDIVGFGFTVETEEYEAAVVDLGTAKRQRATMQAEFSAQRAAAIQRGVRPQSTQKTITQTPTNVSKQEFDAALADGSISLEDAQASIAAAQAAAAPPADPPAQPAAPAPTAAAPAPAPVATPAAAPTAQADPMAAIAALTETVGTLAASVNGLLGAPGAPNAIVPAANAAQSQASDGGQEADPLTAMNKLIDGAANDARLFSKVNA